MWTEIQCKIKTILLLLGGSESFSSMHAGQWFWIRLCAQIQDDHMTHLKHRLIILLPAQCSWNCQLGGEKRPPYSCGWKHGQPQCEKHLSKSCWSTCERAEKSLMVNVRRKSQAFTAFIKGPVSKNLSICTNFAWRADLNVHFAADGNPEPFSFRFIFAEERFKKNKKFLQANRAAVASATSAVSVCKQQVIHHPLCVNLWSVSTKGNSYVPQDRTTTSNKTVKSTFFRSKRAFILCAQFTCNPIISSCRWWEIKSLCTIFFQMQRLRDV